MKKISKLLLLFAALIFCCDTLRASEVDKRPVYYVYWFSVSIKPDSEHKEFKILDSERKVNTGSPKSFLKAVKQGYAHGQVVIGPFHTEKEAKNARIYYKKSPSEIIEQPQPNAPSEIYWFTISLIEKHSGYKPVRSPAAVSAGSADEFVKDSFEALQFERIAIGPFWDYTQAEEAKAFYRYLE